MEELWFLSSIHYKNHEVWPKIQFFKLHTCNFKHRRPDRNPANLRIRPFHTFFFSIMWCSSYHVQAVTNSRDAIKLRVPDYTARPRIIRHPRNRKKMRNSCIYIPSWMPASIWNDNFIWKVVNYGVGIDDDYKVGEVDHEDVSGETFVCSRTKFMR